MDLFSLFLFTYENNEIKSPTKIKDFTVFGCDIVKWVSLIENWSESALLNLPVGQF